MSGAPIAERTLAPGTCFGRYRIVRLIGVGGMGAVYQAQHLDLNKIVALKVLSTASDGRVRLLNEGEAAARIRHRNVVDVYDVGTHDDTVYLVMEYLAGEDLRAHLDRGKTFDTAQLAALLLPLCAALQAAHRQGVVHRDVKPSNVFLAQSTYEDMTPKLLDFGISKMVDRKTRDGGFGAGLLLGTLPYMAPEQAVGARAGGSIDQYSMGVMLYRIVTGRLPFTEGVSMHELLVQVSQGDFVPPKEASPSIHPGLEALIVRAMARDPDERFDSMLDMGRALLPFADTRTADQWVPVFGEAPASRGATRLLDAGSAPVPLAEEEPEEAPRSADFRDEADSSSRGSFPSPSWPFHDAGALERPWIPVVGGLAVVFALVGGTLLGVRAVRMNATPSRVIATGPSAEVAGRVSPTPTARVSPTPTARVATAVEAPNEEEESYRVGVVATPRSARIAIDGRFVGRGRLQRQFPRDGRRHVLTVTAPGYQRKRIEFRDRPPLSVVVLDRAEPQTPPRPPKRTKKVMAKKTKTSDTRRVATGTNEAPIIP